MLGGSKLINQIITVNRYYGEQSILHGKSAASEHPKSPLHYIPVHNVYVCISFPFYPIEDYAALSKGDVAFPPSGQVVTDR